MGMRIEVNGIMVEIPQAVESEGGAAIAAYLDKIAREQSSQRSKAAKE